METVSTRGGVKHFTVHARNAVLGGLSPAQNRQIPPLRYHLVTRLAQDFPELRFSLNGGIETIEDAKSALWPSLDERSPLSGVMVGRAVVARPWDFATLDTDLYGEEANYKSAVVVPSGGPHNLVRYLEDWGSRWYHTVHIHRPAA